ncbi:hypothetical protein TIFTF001_011794 [Ficus carica]|uniref:Uncharacterized protein n=1 Tax=Ficus carica TaxID=3494 RepID=A0AA88AEV7_FICCA|nr:hypothetical protein TIFTF001_011794 [Ficus carica]
MIGTSTESVEAVAMAMAVLLRRTDEVEYETTEKALERFEMGGREEQRKWWVADMRDRWGRAMRIWGAVWLRTRDFLHFGLCILLLFGEFD